MQTAKNVGRGILEYLTPEITAIDIAVEQGFAQSGKLENIPYDDSWEQAN